MEIIEEKKHYIRPKGMELGESVWNFMVYKRKWDTNSKTETHKNKTKFTRKEIKELTGQELEHYSYCEVGTDTWVN